MEALNPKYYPYLIAIAVAALLLVVWLVYRNLKDENEFEHELDEPGQNIKRPHNDETKV
jgi:hypothetical protein